MKRLLLLSLFGSLPLTGVSAQEKTDAPCPILSGRYLCEDRTYDIKQSKTEMGFAQYEILEKGIQRKTSTPAVTRVIKLIVNYHSLDGAYCVSGSVTDKTPDHRIQYSLGKDGSLIVTDLTDSNDREGARPFTCRKDIVANALNQQAESSKKSSDRTGNKAIESVTEGANSIPNDAHAMPAISE